MVEQGKLKEALSDGQESPLPAARVLAAGAWRTATPNPSYSKAMEVAAQSEMPTLKRRLVILDTIITLAPLLGLLGTITGMISSFGIMSDVGLGQPHALTGGIAEALIATATGLLIAILTLILYNYFYLPRRKRNGGYRILRLKPGTRPARATGGPLMRLQRKGNLKKARIEIILHDRYDLFSAGLLYDLNALHVASLSLRAGSKSHLDVELWKRFIFGLIFSPALSLAG